MRNILLISCLILIAACNQGTEQISDHPAYHNPTVQPYTDAVATWPDSADLYFQRSLALSKIDQDSLVLIDLQKAASLAPKKTLYLNAIGYVQLNLGHPDRAITAFKKSLSLKPGDAEIRLQLAQALMENHQLDAAASETESLIQDAPRYLPAQLMQAKMKAAQKDTAAAIQLTAAILNQDHRYYEASLQLADWYKATGDNRAVEQYHYTFTLNPDDATPLYEIGRFFQQKKQWEDAKAAYKSCVLTDGDYTYAYIHTAEILMQQDSLDKARRILNIALATEPANADAWYYTGACFEKMHQADSARHYYDQAAYFGYDAAVIRSALSRLQ